MRWMEVDGARWGWVEEDGAEWRWVHGLVTPLKVLHSPIIIFLLKFLFKGVTKSLFYYCHKKRFR